MKVETQASRLERMMRQKRKEQLCEVALPPVQLKSSMLRRLEKGDLLLLGMERFEIVFVKEGSVFAKGELLNLGSECRAEYLEEPEKIEHTKKYETLLPLLGSMELERVRQDERVDISGLTLTNITLKRGSDSVAKGELVECDGTIAVKIEKVYR